MALALAFAAAGCGPPHPKVPVPHVPEPAGEFSDAWKNIRKYEKVEKAQHVCYDDQGIPYSYDC